LAAVDDRASIALEAMSGAVRAIASERSVDPVLQRIVDVSRELGGARYAALGVPDGEGNFAKFITSGMSDELIARLGPLPRTHGMLGAMLDVDAPYRTPDIKQDPRFRGWWPRGHPSMASFLGVPISSSAGVLGAIYLTDKVGADEFTEEDERLIEMLAAHAAIAIENARLYERGRELSMIEERNRLARDLHDSVVQKLFGVVLASQSAATLFDRDPGAARGQLDRLQELTQDAVSELRSLIFQLRPADVEADGLAAALDKHVGVLRKVHRQAIELHASGEPRLRPGIDEEVFRIAQEALHNALKHAAASRLQLTLDERGETLSMSVSDDGVGFDPSEAAHRSRRLGLTSMEERAQALGGELTIDSRPGSGTTIELRVPLNGDSRRSS
jgi:signal transduction histidine kinase